MARFLWVEALSITQADVSQHCTSDFLVTLQMCLFLKTQQLWSGSRALTFSKAELTCPLCSSCRALTGVSDADPARSITGDVLLTDRSSLLAICWLTTLPSCVNPRHNSSRISRGNAATRDCSKLSITTHSAFVWAQSVIFTEMDNVTETDFVSTFTFLSTCKNFSILILAV